MRILVAHGGFRKRSTEISSPNLMTTYNDLIKT